MQLNLRRIPPADLRTLLSVGWATRGLEGCVVGVGGLGNPIVTRLATMGIGNIRIVDRDVIELSNLHRQTMFNEDDVGQGKVETAAKKLREDKVKKIHEEIEKNKEHE